MYVYFHLCGSDAYHVKSSHCTLDLLFVSSDNLNSDIWVSYWLA